MKSRSNKLPIILLGALILIAIVWRIASPPAESTPGPVGTFPNWNSSMAVGKLGPWSVNQAGTLWAGAWNFEAKDGSSRSAVWIVNFNGYAAMSCSLDSGYFAKELTWDEDGNVRVAAAKTNADTADDAITVFAIDAESGKLLEDKQVNLDKNIVRVVCWNNGLAQVKNADGKLALSKFSQTSGKLTGNTLTLDLPADSEYGRLVATDKDSNFCAITVVGNNLGQEDLYLVDFTSGKAVKAVEVKDLMGRVEQLWSSGSSIMAAVCDGSTVRQLSISHSATNELQMAENVNGWRVKDVTKPWGHAVTSGRMLYEDNGSLAMVTNTGGYQLATGVAGRKQLFDFSKNSKDDYYWQRECQGGRLYKLKNGNYVCVSEAGNKIDIREIKKDGSKGRVYLARG